MWPHKAYVCDSGTLVWHGTVESHRPSSPEVCQRDWSVYPNDAFLVQLGGYHWQYGQRTPPGYRETTLSFGAYAFMVPRHHLKALIGGFQADVTGHRVTGRSGAPNPQINPGIRWYRHANKVRQRIYAVDPLLVHHTHHPAGYSSTYETGGQPTSLGVSPCWSATKDP